MCGIAGHFNRNGPAFDLARPLALMAHRGPDGSGQWHEQSSETYRRACALVRHVIKNAR